MGREEIKKKKARRQNLESVEPEACHDGTQFAAFHERGESSKGNLAERRGNDPGNSNCCWEKRKEKKKNFQIARFPVFPIKTKRISVDYTRDSYSSVSFRKRGEEGEGEFATVKLSERLIAGTTIGHCACDEASEIRFNANVFVSSVFNQSPILIFEIANPFPPSRQIDRSLSYPIEKL